jgi:hypothetical protein
MVSYNREAMTNCFLFRLSNLLYDFYFLPTATIFELKAVIPFS